MSINAHRIKKVIYEDNAMTFRSVSNLASAIERHPNTADFRNMEGGGIIELPLSALKGILSEAEKNSLDESEIKALTKEIAQLEADGYNDGDYILYDMF